MPAMTIEMRAQTEQARNQVVSALGAMNREALVLARQLNGLSSAMATQREAVDRARTAYQTTSDSMRRLKDNVKGFKDELGNVNKTIADNQAKIERARASTERYTQKLDESIRTYGAFSKEAERASNQLDNAARRAGTAQTAIVALNARKKQLSQQIADNNRQIDALNTRLVREGAALHGATQAAAALATQKARLATQSRDLQTNITDTNRQLSNLTKTLREGDKAIRDNAESMTSSVVAANLLTGAFRSIRDFTIGLIKETVTYAARTYELGIVMEQVARVNGITVGQIRAQEKAIRDLNISTQEARQVLSQFVAAQMDVTKASTLARTAQDLAVISGAESAETFQRLTQGIQTLQIRVLRTAGVYVSLDSALDRTAKTSGRQRDSFSQLEKQNILLNTVLDYGARVTGTYDAAMQSASKQMRSMIRIWNDAKNAMGSLLQGPFALAIKLLTQILKIIEQSPKATVLFLGAITLLAGKIAYFTAINMGWAASFKEVALSMRAATASALGLQGAAATQAAGAATASQGGAYYSLGGAFRAIGGGRTLGTAAGAVGGGVVGGYAGGSTGAGLGAGVGTAATLLGTGLSATGIGAIAVGVGALTYAIHSYATARKEASKVDEEDLELALRRLRTNREDITAFEQRATQIRASSGTFYELHSQQREYALAIGRLTPVVQANISTENDRATALQRVADALRNVNQETAKSIISQSRNIALAIGADDVAIRDAQRRYSGVSGMRRRYSGGNAGALDTGRAWVKSVLGYGASPGELSAGGGGGLATMEAEAFSDYNATIESRRRHFEALSKAAYTMNKELGVTTAEFLNQIEVLKNNPALMQEAIREIQNYTAAEEERQRRLREGIVAYQEFQEQVKEALSDLNSGSIEVRYTQEGLNKQLTISGQTLRNSMSLTQDWSTSVGIASNQLGYLDETLVKLGGTQEGYNALIAHMLQTQPDVAAAIFTLNSQGGKAISKFGEDAANAANKIADVQAKIRNLRREVTELASGAGEAGRLEILVSQLESIRAMQQQIIDQRTKLGRPQSGISQSAEDMEEEIRRNKNELEVIENIRERLFRLESLEADVQKEQIGYDVIRRQYLDDEFRRREVMLRSQLLFDRSNNERLETEKKITSEIIAQGAERRKRSQEQNASNAEVRRFMLEQIRDQQQVLISIEEATNRERAELTLRRNRDRITNGLLGEYGGAVGAAVPNIQRQSLAINELPPAITQLSALNTISNHTFTIANSVTQTLPQILQTLQNPPQVPTIDTSISPARSNIAGVKPNIATDFEAATSNFTALANSVSADGRTRTGAQNNVLDALMRAIMGQESGGRSAIQNARTSATGLYQVMPDNIGPWTQAALGRRMGVAEFRANADAQTAVARWQMGNYLSRAMARTRGNVEESVRQVASSWYGGEDDATNASRRRFRANEPSFYEYRESVLNKFRRALGQPPSVVQPWNTFRGQLGQNLTPFVQSPTSPAATTMQQAVNQITGQNADSRKDVINKQLTDELMRRDAAKLERFGAPPARPAEEDMVVDTNAAVFKEVKINAEEAKRLILEFGKISDENVRDFYNNIGNEMSIYQDVFTSVKNNYNSVKESIRNLAVERAMDASGWQESQAHLTKIVVDGEITRRRAARETKDEILRLQDEIVHVTEGSADRIEAAYLRAVKEIKLQNESATADVRIALAKIEDAGKFHEVRAQARILQYFSGMKSSSDIYADGVIGTFDAVFGVIDNGLTQATSKLGIFGGVIKQVMSDLARMFLSRAFMKFMPDLFGQAAPSGMIGGNVGGTGAASSAGNAQQILSGLGIFNTGNGNASQLMGFGGTGSILRQFSPLNPDQSSLMPARAIGPGATAGPWVDPSTFTAQFGDAPGRLSGATSLMPSLMASASAMLPAAALTISLSTWQAALSGNIGPGKGLLGGGLVGLGLSYIGRSRLRRQEERRRTEMLGDAKTQIQRLVDAVRRDRTDGDSALSQAQQIRDQYLQTVATLKDKKTRNIAAATVRELDYLIGQLQTAALQQRRRKEIDDNLVPEFATGGIVPGIDRGRDSVLAALRPGEVVLNRQQQFNLSRMTSPDVFRQIGVPGFDRGGVVRPVTMYQTQTVTNNNGGGGNIYIVADRRYAEDMARRAGGTILHMVDDAISRREGLYTTVRRAAGNA